MDECIDRNIDVRTYGWKDVRFWLCRYFWIEKLIIVTRFKILLDNKSLVTRFKIEENG